MTATCEADIERALRYQIEVLGFTASAKHLLSKLENVIDLLAVTPELKAESLKGSLEKLHLREWYISNYVLVYRFEEQVVYLEHFFHQSQDFENLL